MKHTSENITRIILYETFLPKSYTLNLLNNKAAKLLCGAGLHIKIIDH